VLVVACILAAALEDTWPVALAGLMLAIGLVLDAAVYDRVLEYQPGWLALPLGVLELAATVAAVRLTGLGAPLLGGLALFAFAWLVAQILAHAGFPLAVLSYGEDGGELGRAGAAAGVAALLLIAGAGGVAWATRPPTVHLSAGVHAGPLVLDHAQTLVGEPGAVVRGGIDIRADGVTVRNVTVLGGENGITVEHAQDVVLDGVTIAGATMDGVHVRRSEVRIHGCRIDSLGGPYRQGIDISFGFDLAPSVVEGCTLVGGQEGIVSHFAHVMIDGNRVTRTTMRGIAVTEMSMGRVTDNDVGAARGVGIFCGDYSMCEVEENAVHDTVPDRASGDAMRDGYAIVAHYGATATVWRNTLTGNHHDAAALAGGHLRCAND
jgi:hypothetical protein